MNLLTILNLIFLNYLTIRKRDYIDEFNLSAYEATILVSDIEIAKYFEEVVAKMGKNRDISWLLIG